MKSLGDTQHVRWLRSRPAPGGFKPEKVNAEAGILYDVVMVQEGEAKGHGVLLDADFISDLVDYDQRVFSNRGIKARFGHPSASSETMGTQAGVFRNVRKRKQDGRMQAIADLHLLEAADDSPTHPGMRAWILKMAVEQPDFIMSSIVFRAGGYFQKKKNGHKMYVESAYESDPELGDVFVEFGEEGEHFYTDLVEQGAATDSLFSTKVNPDFFVSRAHEWLDENPDILQFVKDNPQRVQFFLQRLGISVQQPQQKKMSKFSLWKWLNGELQDGEPTADDLESLQNQLTTAKSQFTALQGEKDALENRVNELASQVDTLQTNLAALKDEAEALKQDAEAKAEEIERLKAEAADTHTGGDTNAVSDSLSTRPYLESPITKKAFAMRQRAKQNA